MSLFWFIVGLAIGTIFSSNLKDLSAALGKWIKTKTIKEEVKNELP